MYYLLFRLRDLHECFMKVEFSIHGGDNIQHETENWRSTMKQKMKSSIQFK